MHKNPKLQRTKRNKNEQKIAEKLPISKNVNFSALNELQNIWQIIAKQKQTQ